MNDGKICVSVCAETADEFIENIKRAAEFADVIELRFDSLNESEFDSALQKVSVLDRTKPFLATFRPKNKHADLTPAKRIYKNKKEKELHRVHSNYRYAGWEKILEIKSIKYVDLEYDIHSKLIWNILFINFWGSKFEAKREREFAAKLKGRKLIVSEHYFLRNVIDLDETYRRLSPKIKVKKGDAKEKQFLDPAIIKIAAHADDVANSIAAWNLLEKAKSENRQIIPIAMGASGVWTRILGLAHGAFMTYAALDEGKETAVGQITAKDLIETYRVKELNENTEIYGIIGGNTSYSVSPFMHNAAFKFRDLNSVYIPFEVKNLDDFIKKFLKKIELNFKGFSVTIPHKQAIIKYLDEIDETAKAVGAVNTVKIENGKLFGYNTDANGFIEPLKTAYGDLQNARVAVFGAGGAARACIYALKKQNADVTIFARDLAKTKKLTDDFKVELRELPKTEDQRSKTIFYNFDIIANATPLGSKGEFENKTILTAGQLEGVKLVYDLVYNPLRTRLMIEAQKANVPAIGGLEMLIAQAAAQQKIWTEKSAPIEEMRRAALLKLG